MLKHIYLILIATFVFGFICGVLLWLFNNTGDGSDFSFGPSGTEQGFSVVVRAYGGCDTTGCPSYRIDEDGEYVYIQKRKDTDDIRNKDSLSRSEFRLLKDLAEDTDFEVVLQTTFSGTCPIAYDELGYRYTISYEGVFYKFDSCAEELEGEIFFSQLERYFVVFKPI